MHKLAASFIFFTRLPLWRWVKVDASYYSRVVECWPAVGWLTGCFTAGVLWLLTLMLPPLVAVTGAFASRVLLTGAMHEDGLADFFDGFGGGTTRERILAIMKDSHIGCYGTIGLVLYFILYYSLLSSFDPAMIFPIVIAADCFSKLYGNRPVSRCKKSYLHFHTSILYGERSVPCSDRPFCISFLIVRHFRFIITYTNISNIQLSASPQIRIQLFSGNPVPMGEAIHHDL